MEKLIYYKLIFYIPLKDVENVKEAIFQAGAGALGEYQRCSWQCLGTGQFMPNERANPSIGKRLSLCTVDEFRVEILCSELVIKDAIKALIFNHPYEEPAYEVVKLENIII